MLSSYFKHFHWSLNIDRWSDELCHWYIKPISSSSLSSVVSALSRLLHSSRKIITCVLSSLASLCLSSHPSLPNERETLVSLRLTGSSARGGKMRREREGRWRQRGGMRKEEENRKKAQPVLTVNCVRKGEFVLETWLLLLELWGKGFEEPPWFSY